MSGRTAVFALVAAVAASTALGVEGPDKAFQSNDRLLERDGESIFVHVCAGCHMPDAKGAVGAGRYPALAQNTKLATASYPVFIVTNGRAGMPAFGRYFDDQQIAGVINYVRTHFGNGYNDTVTSADVKAVRPK